MKATKGKENNLIEGFTVVTILEGMHLMGLFFRECIIPLAQRYEQIVVCQKIL